MVNLWVNLHTSSRFVDFDGVEVILEPYCRNVIISIEHTRIRRDYVSVVLLDSFTIYRKEEFCTV